MIETPMKNLPAVMQAALMEGYLPVPDDVEYQYNCPDVPTPTLTGEYSLYHLYAHNEEPPDFAIGDSVTVGSFWAPSGTPAGPATPICIWKPVWAVRPGHHHHGALRGGITEEQMSNYCLWRSSGYYQVVDPFDIFISP